MTFKNVDDIRHEPECCAENLCTDKEHIIVYFVTGNPGLVRYYRTYLSELHQRLQTKESNICFHVISHSLPGFELRQSAPPIPHGPPPFDLRETITIVRERLDEDVREIFGTESNDSPPRFSSDRPPKVILIGHSVGSYILLELLAHLENNAVSTCGKGITYDVVGGILLFPTVVELARSPMAKKLKLVFAIPYLPIIMHMIVWIAFSWLPHALVTRIVQIVNGMPRDAAGTTASFLQSRHGVRQALHLARFELQEMTTDKWSDEIWGVAKSASIPTSNDSVKIVRPRLYFYFGENDKWIANATRDTLIASRAAKMPTRGHAAAFDDAEARKPKMEIDSMGVPHDFCIRHSSLIATKTAEYVDDVVARMSRP